MSWAPIDGPSPPAARSTHCRRQRPKWSIVDGETDTGTSAPRRGRSSLTSRSAHHWAGSAPGTPCAARVASAVTAAPRVAGSGPASSRRSSATSPGRVSGRATSVNARGCGSGSTTSRNGEGCSSSLRTAVTTSRSRARVTATWNSRVSSCRTCARAARGSSPRPVTTSTRSVEPSSEPRSRRSGHTPSCTPATTTRSHSRPAQAAGVTRATDSPAGARATRVSPATSWPSTWSRKSAGEAPGSRSTNRAAASNRPSTASRSRSARPPPGPATERGVAPGAGEAAGAPHPPEHDLDPLAVAQGVDGRGQHPVRPAGGGRLGTDPVERRTARAPPRRAARRWGGHLPSSSSRRRSDRRNRRSSTASAPPTGEVSTSTTSAGSSCSAPATTSRAQRSRVRNGRTAASSRTGEVGGGGVDGHPGTAQHPAQGGGATPAAHDDGHLRPRHAVEQVRRPQPPGDVAGLLRRRAQQVCLDGTAVAHRCDATVRGTPHHPDVRRHPRCRGEHTTPAAVRGAQEQGRRVGPGRRRRAAGRRHGRSGWRRRGRRGARGRPRPRRRRPAAGAARPG